MTLPKSESIYYESLDFILFSSKKGNCFAWSFIPGWAETIKINPLASEVVIRKWIFRVRLDTARQTVTSRDKRER